MGTTFLQWMSTSTPGSWWVDTGVMDEIDAAIDAGAAGVTMNPLLLARGVNAESPSTREVVTAGGALPDTGPARAIEITRRVAVETAARLRPLFDETSGESGYVCAQVNPRIASDANAMIEQAKAFASWAPNVLVKLPVTSAGLIALEACIARGINITATVSFSLPQMVATAEAHERGAKIATEAGMPPGRCYAVIMLGRLDDHLKRGAPDVDPGLIDHAGIAVAKRARTLFAERGYTAAILPSGMRHTGHLTSLVGGEFVFSISPEMAREIDGVDPERRAAVASAVDPGAVEGLMEIADFRRAYAPDGMKPEEFAAFGAAEFTLTQFAREGWDVLEQYEP